MPDALIESGIIAGPAEDPRESLALYVHWPFCRSKCPYCDFNSHVRATIDEARWRRALIADLEHAAAAFDKHRLTSIFFGGGTPSLMPPAIAAEIISRAGALWGLAPDIEITLEANPTSAEAGSFAAFREAGVNRLSLGVQALEDSALRFLGRQHSAAEALGALDLARRHFPRVSFDLIYGRPGQGRNAWRAELAHALERAADHLSLYQLTIEPGTAFHVEAMRGRLACPDPDEAAELYDITQELCEAAGLPAYEVSNHARPSAESRHNLTYWRYEPYVGIGPGAHGRVRTAGRTWATTGRRTPEAWLDLVEAQGHGLEAIEAVAAPDQAAELLMMGLRLREGVSLRRLDALTDFTHRNADAIRFLEVDGLVLREGDRLRATPHGRLVLNAVLAELLA